MAHGQPDFGMYAIAETIYKLTDMGELATRLGSIVTFDRRGDVVWLDDFEAAVLRWTAGASAGSSAPVLSTTEQWMGVKSVYFATVAGAGEYSRIGKNLPLSRLGKSGVEFFILLESRTPGYMQLRVNIEDGTNLSYAELRLDSQARTASIITPTGTIVIATNCFPTYPNKVWVPVKLVVDMDTDLYTRLLIGDQGYDISSYALVPVAASTNRYLDVYICLVGDIIATMYAYLENFILTQNEP